MQPRKSVPAPFFALVIAVAAAVATYVIYRSANVAGNAGYRWLCLLTAVICLRFVLNAWNAWDELRGLKRQQRDFEEAAQRKGTSRMATIAEMKDAGLGVYSDRE